VKNKSDRTTSSMAVCGAVKVGVLFMYQAEFAVASVAAEFWRLWIY